MKGQRLDVPTVGLLICIAQLVAIARQQYWPPLAAAPGEIAALWNAASLTYVIVSGLLRVSLLVLIRASSASTLQLLNALAVPLGAAFYTSGFQHNTQALVLASGGAFLYLFGQQQQATNYILGQQRAEVKASEQEEESAVQEEPETKTAEADVVRDEVEAEVVTEKAPKQEASWMDSITDVAAAAMGKPAKEEKSANGEISKSSSRRLVDSLAVPLGAAILTTSGVGQALLVASGALYLAGQREERKREQDPADSKKGKTGGDTEEKTSTDAEENSTKPADQQQD